MNRTWVTSWLCCGAIGAILVCSSNAHAELLGYWSANDNSDEFGLPNDSGKPNASDLNGELFGDAAYTDDGQGVTGLAGDRALNFNGVDEDYAEIPHRDDITFEEITLTAWLKGEQTGDWSGIFQSRGNPPIGMGYGGGTGNLTYTWNNNNGETYNFGGGQPQLNIPPDEWTFVALTVEPDNATLYVGPKGGALESASNEIPHLAQLPSTSWRLSEDDCCGTERNFLGLMDDAAIWNHRLTAAQLAEIHSGAKLPTDPSFAERVGGLRQVQVAGTGLGLEAVSGDVSNVVKGDPVETSGLSQFWYEGNMRANVEAFQDAIAGENGSEANPLVAPEFASETTWWAGSQGTDVISDLTIEKYPSQGLAGTRFAGSGNEDNYSVVLRGEINIKENGEYLIRDGIDDFTLVAIDQDGNGELDDYDTISSGDVGQAGFGDILVLDDDWANLDGSSQEAAFHGIADFEGVTGDGDWRKIEVWMSEGGGGDGGILYMGNLDDPDIFDDTNGGALTQEERDKFVIRNEDLRTTVAVVESADAAASLATNVEYVMQVAADGSNDQIAVDDNDGVFTTTLDVTGATVFIDAAEGIADGASFQIFDADSIVGGDQLTLNGIDLSLWSFDAATGLLTFGSPMEFLEADFNMDGVVDFTDFLTLSTQFNQTVDPAGTPPDIDGSGVVDFPDFLTLSTQFGQSSGGPQPVPEPSSLALLSIAGLLGLLRRRRRS